MAEVSVADFRTQFPEFTVASYAEALVQRALDEALLIHSVRQLATLYCAAHILAVPGIGTGAERGGDLGGIAITGEVTSERAGPMASSYTSMAGSEGFNDSGRNDHRAFFTRTEYGRHFLVLEQRSARAGFGARVVG